MNTDVQGFMYQSTRETRTNLELLKPLRCMLECVPSGGTVLDLGCGNGVISRHLVDWGYKVTGVEISESGLAQARLGCPQGRFLKASVTDPELPSVLEGQQFDAVIALEVIEHVFSAKNFIKNCKALVRESGVAILSTPYHGGLKVLLLCLSGRFERHFCAVYDGGHIRFFSRRSLTRMLETHGLKVLHFRGVGRVPWLWKSMLVKAVECKGVDQGGT
jgi:2-polyprenyl-3-methyl-5-hydroxy-6-metoxy-1,4-benzoquinol methylase